MGRKKRNKKSPIDWTQVTVEIIVGLITGTILMILEKLFF